MVPVAPAFAVLGLTGSATDLRIVLAARTVPLVADREIRELPAYP
jgi:hypothetical protein